MENTETFIDRHNVEHYRKLLLTEIDQNKRTVLLKLLAEEEVKQMRPIELRRTKAPSS